MPKVIFRSTDAIPAYRMTTSELLKDGDSTNVSQQGMKYLCTTFADNFFTEGEDKKRQEAAQRQVEKEQEKAATSLPAGDITNEVGDTTGSDTEGLTDEEKQLLSDIAVKVDKGEDLTEAEELILAKAEG